MKSSFERALEIVKIVGRTDFRRHARGRRRPEHGITAEILVSVPAVSIGLGDRCALLFGSAGPRIRPSGHQGEVRGADRCAGPGAKVVSIRRDGVSFRGPRGGAIYRRYEIVVQRHNGDRVHKAVAMPAGLFGSGEVIDDIA